MTSGEGDSRHRLSHFDTGACRTRTRLSTLAALLGAFCLLLSFVLTLSLLTLLLLWGTVTDSIDLLSGSRGVGFKSVCLHVVFANHHTSP